MFSLGNFRETSSASCLLHTYRALPTTNLHIFVFNAWTMHPKVASASSGTKISATLWENHTCSFVFVFFMTTKSETLRGYPYFRNALLIFMIFRHEHGTAVTVGMYAIIIIANYPPGILLISFLMGVSILPVSGSSVELRKAFSHTSELSIRKATLLQPQNMQSKKNLRCQQENLNVNKKIL